MNLESITELPTWKIIESLNGIKHNDYPYYDLETYDNLVNELSKRQPIMAILYRGEKIWKSGYAHE